MKKDIYIFKSGELKRNNNSLTYYCENKIDIPINTVDNIYLFGKSNFNTDLLCFLDEFNIFVHIYDYYGNYKSSICPANQILSGVCKINQVNKYNTNRCYIATYLLKNAQIQLINNLKEYNINTDNIKQYNFNNLLDIQNLMGLEGNMRKEYYSNFNSFLNKYKFIKRTKQPPQDEINCLISFGNSLCYNTCLKQIHKTQLDPTISYLHEPGFRRYSLSLDLAEIFKPMIIDKIIFKLINKNIIRDAHFIKSENYCYLNDQGKKIFLKEYEEKIKSTIYNKKLGRNVSYEYLILLECFKLLKYINENQELEILKI